MPRIPLLIILVTLLGACSRQAPEMTVSKHAQVYRHAQDSAEPGRRGPTTQVISEAQRQQIQTWLEQNRSGWSGHTPVASLLPHWCVEVHTATGEAGSLCSYGNLIVLGTAGAPRPEKSIGEQDARSLEQLLIQPIAAQDTP